MNLLIKLLATGIISLSVLVGGVWIGKSDVQTPVAGSFTPVQASQFTLAGAGVTSSQNTITLTSFKLPDPNKTPIVMSMFGQIGYAVLEPQTSKIENVSFTGVTQNANGTAILTGVSRGLSFYAPFAASTTLSLAHAGGAYLILSNSAAFYGQQFLFSNNVGSSTQQISFSNTAPPLYYPGPGVQGQGSAIASTSEFASVAYVNAVTTSGAPNASTVAKGIVQLATARQTASSTSLGSTGATDVIPSSVATDTPSTQGCSITGALAGGCVAVTALDGFLRQGWLDLTKQWTFTSLFATSASSTNATTTREWITGLAPSLLKVNANGQVVSAASTTDYQAQRLILSSNTDITISGNGDATSTVQLTIPGNYLTPSSTIKIMANDGVVGSGNVIAYLRTTAGTNLCRAAYAGGGGGGSGYFMCQVAMQNAITSQISQMEGSSVTTGGTATVLGDTIEQTSAINFAVNQSLVVVVETTGSPTSGTIFNFNIDVEP